MLSIPELLKCIKELNDEIENKIDDLNGIIGLSMETDGNHIFLRFGGISFWTDEENEINSKEDIKEILLDDLLSLKVQVDGMIKLYREKK